VDEGRRADDATQLRSVVAALEEEIAVADAHPRGARPFARQDYIAKFKGLTEGLVAPAEVDRFLAAVDALISPGATDLGAITVSLPEAKLVQSRRPGLYG